MYEAAEFNRMNKSNGYLPDLFWIEQVRIGFGLSLCIDPSGGIFIDAPTSFSL